MSGLRWILVSLVLGCAKCDVDSCTRCKERSLPCHVLVPVDTPVDQPTLARPEYMCLECGYSKGTCSLSIGTAHGKRGRGKVSASRRQDLDEVSVGQIESMLGFGKPLKGFC